MKNLNKTDSLNEAIRLLQNQKSYQLNELKDQFKITYESLKPIHILKNGIREMAQTSGLKGNFVKIAIGLTAGFLSKKVMIGSSHNPIKKMLGSLLQFVVANVVANNPRD